MKLCFSWHAAGLDSTMSSLLRRSIQLTFVLSLVFTSLYGQVETGQLSGKVVDPSGAIIRGAEVSITKIGTDVKRTMKTTEEGSFTFSAVLPANYELKASAPGFAVRQQNISIGPGQKIGIDMHLEVGDTTTVVQVSEDVLVVNSVSETVGATISSKQVVEFPSLTRNPYDFIATLGNVSGNDPSGRGTGFAINGQRAASTNVLLDGGANNDEFGAGVGLTVPLDSMQEFSVATSNFTAEVGRASGGVVNVVTKSGSNAFHGTGYEFLRVSELASNSFDNNANKINKSTYTRNQPGYSIGGPALKNKLFFFQS